MALEKPGKLGIFFYFVATLLCNQLGLTVFNSVKDIEVRCSGLV